MAIANRLTRVALYTFYMNMFWSSRRRTKQQHITSRFHSQFLYTINPCDSVRRVASSCRGDTFSNGGQQRETVRGLLNLVFGSPSFPIPSAIILSSSSGFCLVVFKGTTTSIVMMLMMMLMMLLMMSGFRRTQQRRCRDNKRSAAVTTTIKLLWQWILLCNLVGEPTFNSKSANSSFFLGTLSSLFSFSTRADLYSSSAPPPSTECRSNSGWCRCRSNAIHSSSALPRPSE